MKKITVKDIAKASGYSVSTVSKTLNGTDRVGKEAMQKIKKIARDMGYRSSFSAQSLARKPRKIGIALFKSPVQVRQMFEQGIAEAFDIYGEFGIECKYFLFDKDSPLCYKTLEKECDAAIITPNSRIKNESKQISALSKTMPVVILQSKPIEKADYICDVTIDADCAGKMAAQMLSLLSRTKKTAIISGFSDAWIHKKNINGFYAFADECGLENLAVYESEDKMENAYLQTKRIIDTFPQVDGIFVTSYVAPAVCRQIKDAGANIQVIGVDLFADSMTLIKQGNLAATIFQDQKSQAKRAVETIISCFRGISVPKHIRIKPELILKSNLNCYG